MALDAPAVMSVFDVEPRFIGGTETYARELSLQLGRLGWRSVLCFVTQPPEEITRFLGLPNVSIELLHQDVTRFSVPVMTRLVQSVPAPQAGHRALPLRRPAESVRLGGSDVVG